MKAAKLVVGTLSILVFGIGIALAVVNGILSNEVDVTAATTGTSLMVLAFSAAFAIGGIVVIARRHREGWSVPLIVWAAVAGTLGFVLMLPAGPSLAQSLLSDKAAGSGRPHPDFATN